MKTEKTFTNSFSIIRKLLGIRRLLEVTRFLGASLGAVRLSLNNLAEKQQSLPAQVRVITSDDIQKDN